MIEVHGSLLASMASPSTATIHVNWKEGNQPWVVVQPDGFDSLGDTTASVSASAYIDLNPNTDYLFAAGFNLSSGSVSLTKSTCHGIVTIVNP